MLLTENGGRVTFISPSEKRYLSFNPLEMLEGAQKMMQSIGGTMTVDTALNNLSVDSLGPGPVIDGHPTLRYRIKWRFHVEMAMMGDRVEIDQQTTQDMDSAPDYDDLRNIGQSMSKFTDLFASFGFAKDFADRVRQAHDRLRGFPLRVVKETTRTSHGVTQKSTETMEISNIRRVSVPDSAFAIPAEYKQLSMPVRPRPARSDSSPPQ